MTIKEGHVIEKMDALFIALSLLIGLVIGYLARSVTPSLLLSLIGYS